MKLNIYILNKIGLCVLFVISLSFFQLALAHKKHKIRKITKTVTQPTITNSTQTTNKIIDKETIQGNKGNSNSLSTNFPTNNLNLSNNQVNIPNNSENTQSNTNVQNVNPAVNTINKLLHGTHGTHNYHKFKINKNLKGVKTHTKSHRKGILKHSGINFDERENDDKQNRNDIYFRWGVFVPLVILIFIITIVSIVSFLYLVIKSAKTLPPLTEIDHERINEIKRANYLAKIRLSKENNKKKKKRNEGSYNTIRKNNNNNNNNSSQNYVSEPETEGMVVYH